MINDVLKTLDKAPNKFVVLSAEKGYFGSLVYRCIVGSDEQFVWKSNFYDTLNKEYLKPLEWPRSTEGFGIYDVEDKNISFKDNHLATAHIAVKLLENISSLRDLSLYLEKNKTLLLKTHDLDIHNKVTCKVIRLVGSLHSNIINKNGFRKNKKEVKPVNAANVYNVNIDNFISEDYDTFLKEYINLVNYLGVSSNVNNVRSFILCLLEKHKRS